MGKKRWGSYLVSFFSPFMGIWTYHQFKYARDPELQEHGRRCLKAAMCGFVMYAVIIIVFLIFLWPIITEYAFPKG
jgi:hypothetical protein